MTDFLKKIPFFKEGISYFDIEDKSTKKVTDFYKESPFPNYKDTDNKSTILTKGNKNLLAAQFKKFIGYRKNVLEVGCGTGQLSIYFSIGYNNSIVGLDPATDSLILANNFCKKNEITNISFVNADIFNDVLKDDFFDFIWCNGVLHHTKDPYAAFKILIKSLKKEGYVLIGLYNKIGRIRTLIRKYLYKVFGKRFLMIADPILRNLKDNQEQQNAWIRDQYIHPIESLHSLDEVLYWFEKNNISFISSIPSCDFSLDYSDIFQKKSTGSYFSRIVNQITMIFNKLGSDGGLFIAIGKKNQR
jgi:ubiquinone/menaquinone biosynthesis C-methylase UbiE